MGTGRSRRWRQRAKQRNHEGTKDTKKRLLGKQEGRKKGVAEARSAGPTVAVGFNPRLIEWIWSVA